MGVIVELISDPANTDAVIAWLASRSVSSEYIAKHEAPDPHYIGAYVPVSLLGPPFHRSRASSGIIPPRRPNLPSEKDSGVAARAAVRRSGAGVHAHSHASANRGQPRKRGPPRPRLACRHL